MSLNQNMPMNPADAGQMVDPAMTGGQSSPMDSQVSPGNIQRDADSFERMATPEEVQSLQELMDDIEDKYRETKSAIIAGENGAEATRKDLVVEMFRSMEELGVDLNNVEEVRAFLDELEASNPDLYKMFVSAFNHLLGDEEIIAAGEDAESGEMMDAASMDEEVPAEDVAEEDMILPSDQTGQPPVEASNPALSGMVATPQSPSEAFPSLRSSM